MSLVPKVDYSQHSKLTPRFYLDSLRKLFSSFSLFRPQRGKIVCINLASLPRSLSSAAEYRVAKKIASFSLNGSSRKKKVGLWV